MADELMVRQLSELAKTKKVTLTVMVLDKSGSMANFGTAPMDMVNEIISKLKAENNDQNEYYFGLVSFADMMKLEIPINKVDQIDPLLSYNPDGNTQLYKTARNVISSLLNLVHDLPEELQSNIKVVVGVVSDGMDNRSPRDRYPEKLQQTSKRALKHGFELLAYGIGIDATRLAYAMGFLEAKGFTLSGQARSFVDVGASVCEFSTCGGWRKNSTPPSNP